MYYNHVTITPWETVWCESPGFYQWCFVPSLLKSVQLCCLEKICRSFMYHCISCKLLLPLIRKKAWYFLWTNLNLLYQTMVRAKSSWNGQVNEEFLKFVNQFSLCHYYFSLEKGMSLQLNKFKFPSPKKALRQIWLILTQLFLGRKWKCRKQYRMCLFGWNCIVI